MTASIFGLRSFCRGGVLLNNEWLSITIASIALAATWLVWAAIEPWWGNRDVVLALFAFEPLCKSVMTVAIFAMCMDLSWPQIAASQFAGYMALLNVSTTLGFRFADAAVTHASASLPHRSTRLKCNRVLVSHNVRHLSHRQALCWGDGISDSTSKSISSTSIKAA